MKRIDRILILVVVVAVIGIGIYHLLPPSEVGQHAVEQLASVHTFSFGPTGYAGSIPEREDEFFAILSSRHSSRLFCDLYERGTPEAKLYALCGLHLAHGDFDAYAARFIQETTNVMTQGGCIGSTRDSADAVSAIKQGAIDRYLPLHREFERARIEYERTNRPAA
jgi:hypothetical protein